MSTVESTSPVKFKTLAPNIESVGPIRAAILELLGKLGIGGASVNIHHILKNPSEAVHTGLNTLGQVQGVLGGVGISANDEKFHTPGVDGVQAHGTNDNRKVA